MKNVKSKKELIIGAITILVLVVIVVIVLFSLFKAKNNLETYTTKSQKLYGYFDNEKFNFNTKITIDTDNNVTKLIFKTEEGKEEEWDLDSEPLYFQKETKALLPKTMSVVLPLQTGSIYKVNYYTEVSKTDYSVKLTNVNLDYTIGKGFLYDGVDTYFFTEDTTIKFNDKEISVKALSYAKVRFNSEVYIYDYDNDKMQYFEKVEGNVLATTDSYEINMSTDSYTVGDSSVLLIKNFDKLKNLN